MGETRPTTHTNSHLQTTSLLHYTKWYGRGVTM